MAVDWITVAAQIVNFLVLVWLLQRFLYGPIIRAMDEREARIADQHREAASARQAAEAELDRYRDMQEDLESRRQTLVREARDEAERTRKSLQSEVRKEVAALRSEWLDNLTAEKSAFLDDMRERSAEAFSAMARRAFGDLANERLEDQIARRFSKALHGFESGDLAKIRDACARAGGRITVRTAFELPRRRCTEITASVREVIAEDAEVAFERSPDLICGVELRAGGQIVRWSLDSFLDDMASELGHAVESRAAGR